ncbi:MAG: hypothetical protein GY722_10605 [bacterium]|nr:hypothetical protein [bacterium]
MDRATLLKRLLGLFPGEDNTGFNAFDLIHKFGSPLTALLYSELFWPEFVEFEDMVFLASDVEDDHDRDRIMAALEHYDGDKQKTEGSFNYVEVPLLFGNRIGESSDIEDRLLTARIAAMWRARLAEQFPGRIFKVAIAEPGDSGEVGIRFFQATGERVQE